MKNVKFIIILIGILFISCSENFESGSFVASVSGFSANDTSDLTFPNSCGNSVTITRN